MYYLRSEVPDSNYDGQQENEDGCEWSNQTSLEIKQHKLSDELWCFFQTSAGCQNCTYLRLQDCCCREHVLHHFLLEGLACLSEQAWRKWSGDYFVSCVKLNEESDVNEFQLWLAGWFQWWFQKRLLLLVHQNLHMKSVICFVYLTVIVLLLICYSIQRHRKSIWNDFKTQNVLFPHALYPVLILSQNRNY